MTDRLRWGILATGGIAHAFTNDLKLNGFTVQAVGSRSQAAADEFAAEFGIPNAHGSYEALVADPEVDVVYVSTPHPLHAAGARLVLDAGKHVLVEKPFTLNAREAQEIADLAAARGLLALEAMWTRYLPHMVRIRELIADGALGEVRTLIVDHTQKLSDDPATASTRSSSAAARCSTSASTPSRSRGTCSAPRSRSSRRRPSRRTGADAQIANLFAYDEGRIASMLSASDTLGPEHRGRDRHARPHRDRPGLVHADDASAWWPPTAPSPRSSAPR